MTDRLNRGGKSSGLSAYHAWEWAQMARARGHLEAAEAWEKADREGWDADNFSEERRAELARKYPGSFKHGMMVVPDRKG